VTGRGQTYSLRTPVLLLGDETWADVPLGAQVRVRGELTESDSGDASALLIASGSPEVTRRPSIWWRASDRLRAAVRASVAGRPADQRALVPALVDGDESSLDESLADDFRVTGLTHLLAVSGTNLTLVVGFLLLLARWCRVRGRWLYLVGAAGIAGFVLLARTEPSVLRAAVMGGIGILALDHRERALRSLGLAVVALLLLDPGLATTAGFALSVLATAGIVVIAPAWRDALAQWLPRWLAEAVAVPAAAQLACTPVIAVLSGQVSLVAVAANLLADPAVAPATVLGLAGGLIGLIWMPLGRVVGTLAGWCVAWIVAVAHRCADLPTPALSWGTGAASLAALVVLTGLVAFAAPQLLRHRTAGLACSGVLAVAMLVRVPTPSSIVSDWPPPGWIYVVCDVGQGDGTVLNAGPHAAIVVDTGPDPGAMDRCLDRLGVRQVPLLVLTHFHADHVDGVSAVFDGRDVGQVWTSRLRDPPEGVREVESVVAKAGVAEEPAPYGAAVTIGAVTLQVLWPLPDSPTVGPGDGSTANEASVVLLAETHGVRLLLTGDIEPEGQESIARALPGLHVDVLKVPHHGSRYQDEDWLLSLHPSVAITSVGADNDYGHPAASTLDPLRQAGIAVYRTDQDGSVAVIPASDGLAVGATG
jgi:competence protein ComEC